MRKSSKFVAKWAWIACVAAAAWWLLSGSQGQILKMLHHISPGLVVASILITVLAKVLLAENARLAALCSEIPLDFMTAARLYNLSQLGKYLPGSVWQFVGRAAAYRRQGAEYGPIRDALLIESLWVVAGSASMGVALTGSEIVGLVQESLTSTIAWWLVGGTLVAMLGLLALLAWKRQHALRYSRMALPSRRVVVVQVGIWGSLGLAFWVLARGCGLDITPVFAIGLFATGYALGFLVPFAPAGLGVRDAVLTVGLLPYVPAGEALVVTILARLVYLLVDVGLVLVQEPVFALLKDAPEQHH